MKVDVIIVTKDRQADLSEVVASLFSGQQLPANLIIIDNGTDHSAKTTLLLSARKHSVPIIYKIIKPLGLAYARNLGFTLSTSDAIAFLDDDQIAPHTWLSNFAKKYAANFSKYAAIGGGKKAYYQNNYWNQTWEIIENNRKQNQTYYISTGNCFINNKFIKKHQIKINQKFKKGGEDLSLCQEIIRFNGKIYQDSSLIVLDKFRHTGLGFIGQWFEYGKNLPVYYEVYRQAPKRKLNYIFFPLKHLREALQHIRINTPQKPIFTFSFALRNISFTIGFLAYYLKKYGSQLLKQ